jgi:hypothetical protein
MFGNNRGESRAGCLFMLLLVLVSLFLAYKVAPVYMDKINFEDEMARIVNRAGAENWRDRTIRDQIVTSARGFGFAIDKKKIKVDRAGRFQSASRLHVTMTYRRPVDFPGYRYVFTFESEATALIGRL